MIEKLSIEFAKEMRRSLTEEQMQSVIDHSSHWTYCKSHEYVDANVIMYDALCNVLGIPEIDGDIFIYHDAINKAWTMARENKWRTTMDQFCPACSVLDETIIRFGLLVNHVDFNPSDCPFKTSHVLQSDTKGMPAMIVKVMTELMEHDVVLGDGVVLMTCNDHFIVFRSTM